MVEQGKEIPGFRSGMTVFTFPDVRTGGGDPLLSLGDDVDRGTMQRDDVDQGQCVSVKTGL